MSRAAVVIYAIVMIALIVGLDVTILRDHTLLRLAVNVGIVLTFGAIYFLLLKDKST